MIPTEIIGHKKNIQKNGNGGFTLIEALTVLFIFSLITLTFYSVFTLGTSYIIESKNRLGAVSLANEKIETIRNLEYADIGVQGGIPEGDIPATEKVIRGSVEYEVSTLVKYEDDPQDGTGDDDPIKEDYKHAKVTISWTGPKGARSEFSLLSRFVSSGVEQSEDRGILSVNVVDKKGIGVAQADVHIINTESSPAVDMTTRTNDVGNLIFPGAPYSIRGYFLTVSKDGYETVETIDPSAVTYDPTDETITVVDGSMNTVAIVQDRVVDLKFLAKDQEGDAVPGTSFNFEGGRILGYDELTLPFVPVYMINDEYQTDSNGEKDFDGIGSGEFFISNVVTPEGYTFIGMDGFNTFKTLENEYVYSTLPGDDRTINLRVADNTTNALLIRISDSEDGNRLNGAKATLSNTEGYSEEVTTLADGSAFFPLLNTTQMEIGTYDLKVELENYQVYDAQVEITGGLVEHQVSLEAT